MFIFFILKWLPKSSLKDQKPAHSEGQKRWIQGKGGGETRMSRGRENIIKIHCIRKQSIFNERQRIIFLPHIPGNYFRKKTNICGTGNKL